MIRSEPSIKKLQIDTRENEIGTEPVNCIVNTLLSGWFEFGSGVE